MRVRVGVRVRVVPARTPLGWGARVDRQRVALHGGRVGELALLEIRLRSGLGLGLEWEGEG